MRDHRDGNGFMADPNLRFTKARNENMAVEISIHKDGR